jgi:hypothetical protein
LRWARGRDPAHDRRPAGRFGRYHHAERLRGDGVDHSLSIPLIILGGSAIGRSRAGADLYAAIHAWMQRIPGGLGIANVFACALFAAMAGSSPANCSAIGSAGIPQMRKCGYSAGFAAGIIAAGGTLGILLPRSITMILYTVAAEQSLGRLFVAVVGPALLLVTLFAGYTGWRFRFEYRAAVAAHKRSGAASELLRPDELTLRDRFELLPRVLPFVAYRGAGRPLWRLCDSVGSRSWRGSCSPAEGSDLGRLEGQRSRTYPHSDAAPNQPC